MIGTVVYVINSTLLMLSLASPNVVISPMLGAFLLKSGPSPPNMLSPPGSPMLLAMTNVSLFARYCPSPLFLVLTTLNKSEQLALCAPNAPQSGRGEWFWTPSPVGCFTVGENAPDAAVPNI